jgi:hypothetical protein
MEYAILHVVCSVYEMSLYKGGVISFCLYVSSPKLMNRLGLNLVLGLHSTLLGEFGSYQSNITPTFHEAQRKSYQFKGGGK